MSNSDKFSAAFKSCPGIAILRGAKLDEIGQICDILYENGIMILEIPLNTEGAIDIMSRAVSHCGDRQVVGAGTAITPQQVRSVALAGGQFIISPNTNPDVIKTTKAAGLVSIPGFYTPTEAFVATEAGADYLKLFPAGRVGIDYINDIKTVLSTPIVATGGITLENIPTFMQVCAGVGLASCLYKGGQSMDDTRKKAEAIRKVFGK